MRRARRVGTHVASAATTSTSATGTTNDVHAGSYIVPSPPAARTSRASPKVSARPQAAPAVTRRRLCVITSLACVRQSAPIVNAMVQAILQKDGRRSTLAATVPATILPSPPAAPSITTADRSVALTDPGARLMLSGSARPGYRILGRVDYASQGDGFEGSGTLGEFLVVAGADGTWRTSLSRLIPLPEGRITVTVIAIDQQYENHAKDVAHAAIQAGGLGRFIVVVDSDIDPTNEQEVLWALATRCEPQDAVEIVRNCRSTILDPLIAPEKKDLAGQPNSSRAVLSVMPKPAAAFSALMITNSRPSWRRRAGRWSARPSRPARPTTSPKKAKRMGD